MASDTSESLPAFSRGGSPDATGAQHLVNGNADATSDEASERDVNGDGASDQGDVDLFGDEVDEEPYIKPYAVVSLPCRTL